MGYLDANGSVQPQAFKPKINNSSINILKQSGKLSNVSFEQRL